MPDNNHIRIHISIDAVLYARLLTPIQLSGRYLACDAFLEAEVGQTVDGRLDLGFLILLGDECVELLPARKMLDKGLCGWGADDGVLVSG